MNIDYAVAVGAAAEVRLPLDMDEISAAACRLSYLSGEENSFTEL